MAENQLDMKASVLFAHCLLLIWLVELNQVSERKRPSPLLNWR